MPEAATELPTKPLSAKDRKRIIKNWETAFESKKGEIVGHQKVLELLKQLASPNVFGRDNSKTLVLPGRFSFGANQEVFYTVYSHLCGEKVAKKGLEHEKEHCAVYEEHGVPIEFGIVISKLPDGEYWIIPLISPKFPEDMPFEQRKALAYEANLAVSERSETDRTAIEKHKAAESSK